MIISTTSELQGKIIKEYRGVIFGEVVNGIGYSRDLSAAFTNMMGGRSKEYEEELVNSRADALREMMERAEKIGANAIVGVKVDYETMQGSMLMVIASGTAVIVE